MQATFNDLDLTSYAAIMSLAYRDLKLNQRVKLTQREGPHRRLRTLKEK